MGAGKHQAGMDTGIEGSTTALRYSGHVVSEERGMENDVNTIKGPSINSMRWDARD